MANTVEIIISAKDFASGALGKIGTSLQAIGRTAKIVGLALGAAGGFAIKAFANFESAFAGVRKTVEGTAQDFAILEAGIRNMAKEIPATVEQIAGVAESAGQLGIAKENIIDFTRTMVDLGNTTNLVGEQAASSLARLANITQLPQDQFDRLGSTIVELGNNLATTEAEIVEMSLRLAGAGNQIGLTEAQILSFAGALSSVGIRAEAGGSAISRTMIDIASAVETGSKELALFADVAGLSVDEFKEAFETDAAGAIVTFIEGLGKLEGQGRSAFTVLEDLGLSEIRQRDALLRASGAGDLFRRSLELGSKAWEDNNALTEEANKRYETLSSEFRVTVNTIKDVAIEIGDALAPAFTDVLKSTQEFAETFKNVFLNFPEIVDLTVNLIKRLFVKFFTDFEFFQKFLDNAGKMAVALLQGFGDTLIQLGQIVLKAASIVWVPLAEGASLVIDNIAAIFSKKVKPKTFAEAFEEGGAIILGMFDSIKDDTAKIGDAFKNTGDVVKEVFGEMAESPEIATFIEEIDTLLADTGEKVAEFSEETGQAVVDALTGGEEGGETIRTFWDDLTEHISENLLTIKDLGLQTFQEFQQGVGDAIGNAIVFGQDLGQAFKSLLQNIAKNVISTLVQIGIQRVIQTAIAKTATTSEATGRMAALSAETFAGAFAATAAIPIVGPAIAPGVAAAANAAMLAGAGAAGAAGAATGAAVGQFDAGVASVPRRGTFMLDEGERVLSANQNRDFTNFMEGGGGGGNTIITIENMSMLPAGQAIPDTLLEAPASFWEDAAVNMLEALNVLGGNGATTTLQFQEENI